jgi:hypothetical protein
MLFSYRHAGAKGERKCSYYSYYSFLTFAVDGGEWSASQQGRHLSTGKDPRYPLDGRLGGPHSWYGHRPEQKFFASAGDQSPVVQSVVRHYTPSVYSVPVYRPSALAKTIVSGVFCNVGKEDISPSHPKYVR